MVEREFMKKASEQVGKTLDISLLKPIVTRVTERLHELKKQSSAEHIKIQMGNSKKWHTNKPRLHIRNLENSISNNVGTISYEVYKVDKEGNKILKVQNSESLVTGKSIETMGEYEMDKMVIETIEYRKKMKIEEHPM